MVEGRGEVGGGGGGGAEMKGCVCSWLPSRGPKGGVTSDYRSKGPLIRHKRPIYATVFPYNSTIKSHINRISIETFGFYNIYIHCIIYIDYFSHIFISSLFFNGSSPPFPSSPGTASEKKSSRLDPRPFLASRKKNTTKYCGLVRLF